MHLTYLLAQAGKMETFLSSFQYLTGVLVVLVTLSILWGICAFTGWLVKTLIPTPATVAPARPVASKPQPAAAPAATSGVPPEIVAVIAAAVHSAVGKDARVVSIKPPDFTWEKAGRQAVLGSHRLR